jgi:hypothetical protein
VIALGRLLIGDRLLKFLLRPTAHLHQLLSPHQNTGGQLQHPGGLNKRRFGLKEIGAVDREEGIARLHCVAKLREKCNNPALIRRKHLDRLILVEIDAASRGFLDLKIAVRDRRAFASRRSWRWLSAWRRQSREQPRGGFRPLRRAQEAAKLTVLRGCPLRYDQTASDPHITLHRNSADLRIPAHLNQKFNRAKN